MGSCKKNCTSKPIGSFKCWVFDFPRILTSTCHSRLRLLLILPLNVNNRCPTDISVNSLDHSETLSRKELNPADWLESLGTWLDYRVLLKFLISLDKYLPATSTEIFNPKGWGVQTGLRLLFLAHKFAVQVGTTVFQVPQVFFH